MKKLITLLLLVFALSGIRAMAAGSPQGAHQTINTPTARMMFDAMEKFNRQLPDSYADFKYSCSAKGNIYFGRRITGLLDFPPVHTDEQAHRALDELNQAFDSIVKIPRLGTTKISYGASSSHDAINDIQTSYSCAYRSHPTNPPSHINLQDTDVYETRIHTNGSYTESAAMRWDTVSYVIVQEIIIDTDTRCGAPDMSAFMKVFNSLSPRREGNARVATKRTAPASDWRKIYAIMCAHLWTRRDIVVSYSRANRTIALRDRTTSTTYYAQYLDSTLTLKITK